MVKNKVFLRLYSELNLGDDLFLEILLKRYPNIKFILYAREDYRKAFSEYENLIIRNENQRLNRYSVFLSKVFSVFERNIFPKKYSEKLQLSIRDKYSKVFVETDVFISLGGSIFMQPKKLPYYADIEFYNIVNEKYDEVYYLGCNFGPYSDPKYKEQYESIFREAKDVCFRDSYSYHAFNNIANVRYRPDIVFGLQVAKSKKIKNSVGFSVVSPRNKIDKLNYIKKYSELVEYYQQLGYKIYLFSFCKKQGDEETIENILKLIVNKYNIQKVFYDGKVDDFLKVYGSVEKVYCGRFHSMILSMLFDQNIYPIIYSEKMTNVLKDIGYEGDSIKIEDFHSIDPREVSKKIAANVYNIEKEKSLSEEHFNKLDLVLR